MGNDLLKRLDSVLQDAVHILNPGPVSKPPLPQNSCIQESAHGTACGSLIIHIPHAELLLSVPTALRFASVDGGDVSIRSLSDGSIELEIEATT